MMSRTTTIKLIVNLAAESLVCGDELGAGPGFSDAAGVSIR